MLVSQLTSSAGLRVCAISGGDAVVTPGVPPRHPTEATGQVEDPAYEQPLVEPQPVQT